MVNVASKYTSPMDAFMGTSLIGAMGPGALDSGRIATYERDCDS